MLKMYYRIISNIVFCLSVSKAWDISSTMNATIPTILESTWPENILALKPRVFPNNLVHADSDSSDCEKIHQARSTDVDGHGYLWVLDIGNDQCPPKVIIFDLENKNNEILRSPLTGYDGSSMVSIKINPYTVDTNDHMAYIISADGKFLLAFFLRNSECHSMRIFSGRDLLEDQVHPTDIAFTLDKRLYVTDKLGNLYVSDSLNTANSTEIDVNHLGLLLDEARGLITDAKGYLYYIIPRFGAVVRWNPTRALNAEGHDVLKFHTDTIIQIVFGVRGSLWIAMETMSQMHDHCVRILYHFSNNAIL